MHIFPTTPSLTLRHGTLGDHCDTADVAIGLVVAHRTVHLLLTTRPRDSFMRYCFTTLLVGATVFVTFPSSPLLAVEETRHPASPPTNRTKPAPDELKAIQEAEQSSRTLTNGTFAKGFEGWTIEGEDAAIRLFDRGDKQAVTTFGNRREKNTSRLYQCFEVPDDAVRLIFKVHGGGDLSKTYVSLWHKNSLHERVTSTYNNTPRERHFSLTSLRGAVVTLEVVDESTDPFGFIGVEDFRIVVASETSNPQDQLKALTDLGARFQRYGDGEVYAVTLLRRSGTGSGMEHLAALTNLRSLYLGGPGISDDDLAAR